MRSRPDVFSIASARRPSGRGTRLVLLLVGVLQLGCFSRIEPEVEVPTQPGVSGTWVRGKVVLRTGPGESENAVGWGVRVVWYQRDRDGNGALDPLLRAVSQTDEDGVYAVQLNRPEDPVRVEVQAVRCDWDPDSQNDACCLNPVGCSSPCPQVWTGPVGTATVRGRQVQLDVFVSCGGG